MSFDRVSTCTLDQIELIACYTYGTSEYPNLTDLCDTENLHVVEGALGSCFTDFSVALNPSEVSSLTSQPISLTLGSEVPEELFPVTDLSGVAELQHEEVLGCGGLGFRLANETLASLVTVADGGEVNLVTPVVNDESWIGLH